VGLFGLVNWAITSYMINLSIVLSTLSFCVKICDGTAGNCEDCAVGGDGIRLLWRFLDLWLWVGFGLDMGIGVVWHWICDLWHYRRVCYLWDW
jgi:hypothetical protein